MRFLLVLLLWLFLVGGVEAYLRYRQAPPVPSRPLGPPPSAAGVFALELTASFDWDPKPQADPFALDRTPGKVNPAVSVAVQGETAWILEDPLRMGVPLRRQPVKGLRAGKNEVLLKVMPPPDAAGRVNAIRWRLLRDGQVLSEKVFWTEPGLDLVETFVLELPVHSTAARPEGAGASQLGHPAGGEH